MILSNRHEGKTAIVEIKGRLTLSPELRELKPRIDTVLDSKPSTSLVLNLSGVSDVDSSGLGELVAIHTSATRRGVRIALAEVHPRIKELFAITRLDGIFAVCSDLRSALQHVAQSQVADQSQ